jgi:hypothetical protein
MKPGPPSIGKLAASKKKAVQCIAPGGLRFVVVELAGIEPASASLQRTVLHV